MVEDDLWEEEMIRAGILSIALLMMSSGVVVAGECAKLCDSDWWKIATQAEVAAEIATADLNARAEKGFTPLHIAAGHGTPEHITALLKVGGGELMPTAKGKELRSMRLFPNPLYSQPFWSRLRV